MVQKSSTPQLPTPSERPMLQRRLVERMTLEESAEVAGVTRERVRQIEAGFLGEIRDRLDYFSKERNDLLDSWVAGGDWFATLRPVDDEELVKGAIEAIFDETPQAVARDLGEEAKWESWSKELRMHPDLWFGGVALDKFLINRFSTSEQTAFFDCLANTREFRIDYGLGILYPARTGLYHTVNGLLLQEDDPIPLTWLVKLLQQSGHHPDITNEELTRLKKRWINRKDFRAYMILWEQ